MILRLLFCLIIIGKCLFAMDFADLPTAFQDLRGGFGGTPLGCIVCDKAIGTLNETIDLREFDQYLLDPNNPNNPPFNVPVAPGAYNAEKHNTLMSFYSDNSVERDAMHYGVRKVFLEAIHSFSSLSHTHSEFEVLSSVTSDLIQLLDGTEAAYVQGQFQRIFQDPDELIALRELVIKLRAVSQAIDNLPSTASTVKGLEEEVSKSLEKIPLTMDLVQHFYLPAVETEHASMLGTHNHLTFVGRAALTRALICYGELLKTIPDKKTSDVAKVCIKFRDKAVKVLPRRLNILADDANAMVAHYTNMNGFLQTLHDYIFKGAAAPNTTDVSALLKAWDKPSGGQVVVATGVTNTESTLREMLQAMREISGVTVRLGDVAFLDETNSVWADFENGIENYLRTVDRSVIEVLPRPQQRDKEKELEAIRTKHLDDLRKQRLKEWPEILVMHPVLGNAVVEINNWLGDIHTALIALNGADTAGDLKTKLIAMPARSTQARLWLRAQNMQQVSDFNGSISVYPLVTSNLSALSEKNFESLRLLGYAFCQTAKENIATLPTLKLFETQLIKLRKTWAHPRVVGADWEDVVPSVSTRFEKENEAQAMAILMIKVIGALN